MIDMFALTGATVSNKETGTEIENPVLSKIKNKGIALFPMHDGRPTEIRNQFLAHVLTCVRGP